jgi:hypothetical protein
MAFRSIIYLISLILPAMLRAQIDFGPILQNVSTTSATIQWKGKTNEAVSVELYSGKFLLRTIVSLPTDFIHELVLTKLEPGVIYRYRIISKTETSGYYNFSPSPAKVDRFTFGFMSDAGPPATDSLYSRSSSVIKLMAKINPNFFLVGGDLVNTGSLQKEWTGYFRAIAPLASTVPYWPAAGNHEFDGDSEIKNFKKFHSLPNAEEYYSFRYGTAHFAVLSPRLFAKGTSQFRWLENDLYVAAVDSSIKFIFVMMHYPYYSSGYYSNFPEIKSDLYPLFEKYRVNMVLSGHDHHYERSVPLLNGKKNPAGIVYMVSGGGGSFMLDTKKPQWFTASIAPQREFLHFLRIDVAGDSCIVRCMPVDTRWNAVYDQTVIFSKPPVPTKRTIRETGPVSRDDVEEKISAHPSVVNQSENSNTNIILSGPMNGPGLLTVYDILGRQVRTSMVNDGAENRPVIPVDVQGLNTGIYFASLKTDHSILVTRFVIVR